MDRSSYSFSIRMTTSGHVRAQDAQAIQEAISVTVAGDNPFAFSFALEISRIFFGQARAHRPQPLQSSSSNRDVYYHMSNLFSIINLSA
jgi:hypothetical protein